MLGTATREFGHATGEWPRDCDALSPNAGQRGPSCGKLAESLKRFGAVYRSVDDPGSDAEGQFHSRPGQHAWWRWSSYRRAQWADRPADRAGHAATPTAGSPRPHNRAG